MKISHILTLVVCSALSWYLLTAFDNIYEEDRTTTVSQETEQPEDFKIGIPQTIHYNFSELALEELSPREQKEQIRDWLLLAVLKGNNLSTAKFNEATLDLPPVRYGYLSPVSNLDYGETRTRMISDKEAIALIPRSGALETQDQLCHIADALRKDLGQVPEKIKVYRYEINQSDNSALLTKEKEVDGKSLFMGEAGYFEMPINNLNDFQRFMATVQDITYAKKDYSGVLVLGGRKLSSRTYGNITVEDVAAIWQSEKEIAEKQAAWEMKWREKEEAIKAKWDEELKRRGEYALSSIQQQYDSEINELTVQALLEQQKLKIVTGSGFSLDWKGRSYQYARYDGSLQGTKVGMHLFYTDLIAKIWGNDMYESTPKAEIPEFCTNVALRPSIVYKEEIKKFSESRLWFGKDENGFQFVDNKKELLFKRKSTRIYEASTDPLNPGKETPETAAWSTTINWWNNHYEEVAKYEPEYEYLNEIMKWSVIVGWLNEKGADDLSFLEQTHVNRSNWFPTWAANNPALKFNRWEEVTFYPKGFDGKNVETLPLLKTRSFVQFNRDYNISGGVSLMSKAEVKAISALSEEVAPIARRSIWKYGESSVENGLVSFKGARFKPYDLTRFSKVDLIPESSVKLRNIFGEVKNGGFIKTLDRSGDAITFNLQQGEVGIGNLEIQKAGNGFEIGFQSLEMDEAMLLGKRLSDSPDPAGTLRSMGNIDELNILGDNHYEVKFTGSHNTADLELTNNVGVEIGDDVACRVAGNTSNSKVVNIRWKTTTGGPSRPNDPALQKFVNNDFEGFTQSVLENGDPVAYKRLMEKEIEGSLNEIRNLKDKKLAANMLANLERSYGLRPDISLLKGLNKVDEALDKIQAGNYQDAMNTLNGMPPFKESASGLRFATEALHKIEAQNIPLRMKNCLQNIICNTAKSVEKTKVFVTELSEINGLKAFKKVKWSAKMADGKHQIRIDSRLVADHPHLSNFDWSANTQYSMQQVIELNPDAILLEIPKSKIAQFRLKLTGDTPESVTVKMERSSSYSRSLSNGYSGGNDDDDDDDDDDGIGKYFILIRSSDIK